MKKLSKLFAAILAVVLTLTMVSASASSSTTYEVMDDAIYIASENVPDKVTEYVLDQFSHMYADELICLGFTYEEACNLKLSKGFYTYSYDDTIDSSCVYYFPVMCGSKVIALFIANEFDGSLGYQFGKDDVADALNNLETTSSNPIKIVVSDEAYYAVTDTDVTILSVNWYADNDVVEQQVNSIESNLDIIATESATNVVAVGAQSTYDVSVKKYEDYPESLTTVSFEVAIVDNWTYEDSNGDDIGTCWASVTASLIDFYTFGKASGTASYIRDEILKDRYASTGSYSGSIISAESYIESETGISMTRTGAILSWSDVKTAIANEAPCYTRWSTSSSGHAMALCGYRYESTAPSNSSYYSIYVMDPNKTSLKYVGYGSSYTISNTAYTWTNTLKKS